MEYCLYDFGEIFTGKKSGKLVPGFTGDPVHPLAPACVADYEYPAWARDVFLWWCSEKPEPLYIGGPAASQALSGRWRAACSTLSMR